MAVDVTVIIATRDRWQQLRRSLPHHEGPVILLDNGSSDGSPALVREHFPQVQVVELGRNRGACARNVGVARALTDYVAFADDDSWWAPGALDEAARLFDAHPRMALLAARILVGESDRLDPTCLEMAASPLGTEPDLPGPSVLGFLACGAVLRRDAFLAVGGFDDVVFFFGEEERVALDLAAAGWGQAYVDSVVAHHHPAAGADRSGRAALAVRNRVLTAVLRRPWRVVATVVSTELRRGRSGINGVTAALTRLPAAIRQRRVLPAPTEAHRRLLDS
ncbi:glycosyltransferase family 2 protein [Jatrophihabitans lederbergiae]|uniref:Glycosyltransferase n=1 Tax=Jatrophihabitans lederbergiae TaxID=3075547 RepID=A0ABU2J9G5_9ACTN|nr:glycosyltransferase [Jatrophihabitans sp. DSM 44399]MDT0261629.1 glycosyltransferase [Jatrophihabitans sp. DSM 44399]